MSWLKTLALLILHAMKRTRPMYYPNRWTRLALAPMVVVAVMPALLVHSAGGADTDATFKTGRDVSAADASWARCVALANRHPATSLPNRVGGFGGAREVAS